jgi:hypothetical protein
MTKSESIRLYRDILRTCKTFVWKNDKGIMWSHVLRDNARKEFEQCKHEKDPLVVAQLLFIGRDCLNKTNEGLLKAKEKLVNNIDKSRT